MMGHFIKRLIFGRRRLQPYWQALHALALRGLNIGAEPDVHLSGEEWVIGLFARLLDRVEANIFDVGANVGVYAESVLAQLDRKIAIYCFEPSPSAFNELSRRLTGRSNVYLFNLGFSDSDREAILYSNSPASSLASLYRRDLGHFGFRMNHEERVQLTTLDAFCYKMGIRRIGMLKLDVEGHELSVLEGAKRLMNSGGIDFIQFEFGGCNIDSRTYFRDFFQLLHPRYSTYRILRDGLVSIEDYVETLESFLTTNFVAVRRDLDHYISR